MTSRVSTTLILASLLFAGAWGVWKIVDNSQPKLSSVQSSTKIAASQSEPIPSNAKPIRLNTAIATTATQSFSDDFQRINQLIVDRQFEAAVDAANLLYSNLNSAQANRLKQLFLAQAEQLRDNKQTSRGLTLLKIFAQSFDDIDAWELIGQFASSLKDWPTAIDAYTRYSLLEYQPDLLENKLRELTKVANLHRNDLQKRGDSLSVRNLFQKLYEAHPSYARFQLSLSEAQIALGDIDAARQLLDILQYDPDLGNVAQQTLAQLDDDAQRSKLKQLAKQPKEEFLPSDIVVPLTKIGNSFLANVSFNNKPVRMLLDTGASITSMSADAIRRLGFEPIGRSIQISTANGLTAAPLYRADKVRLGRFNIEGLVVAEINLGREGQFQGLLGTDLLNKVNKNYGYLIDNQQSALIFRRR